MCITRSSGYGNWTFYINGIKKVEGVGLGSNYGTNVGYLLVGMFKGVLTRFNMWDKYIEDVSQIERIAHACSSQTGNVVPWPEVYLWRKGNVAKINSTLCEFTGKNGKSKILIIERNSCDIQTRVFSLTRV